MPLPASMLPTRTLSLLCTDAPSSAFSATIMDAVYGIVVAERDDPVLARAEKVTARFSNIVTPGKYLVEVLPALRFLPSWLPGAQFKRNAEKWRPEIAAARDETFHISMDAIVRLFSPYSERTVGLTKSRRQEETCAHAR